jgi:hypothetical protein
MGGGGRLGWKSMGGVECDRGDRTFYSRRKHRGKNGEKLGAIAKSIRLVGYRVWANLPPVKFATTPLADLPPHPWQICQTKDIPPRKSLQGIPVFKKKIHVRARKNSRGSQERIEIHSVGCKEFKILLIPPNKLHLGKYSAPPKLIYFFCGG